MLSERPVPSRPPKSVFEPAASDKSGPMDTLERVLYFVPQTLKPMLYEFLCKLSVLSGNQTHYSGIYRLPMNLVLKVSTDPTGNEAAALRFIKSIHGDTVADIWDQLTESDKAQLAAQLREQVSGLHEQTVTNASQHSISLASGDPIIDPRVPWLADDPRVSTTTRDLFQQLWVGLDYPWNVEVLQSRLQPLIEREDVPVVFCHGDILRKNLILPGGLQKWRSGASVVCLIDWEYAGWMPLSWDALKATWMTYSPEDEWYRMMKVVFPEANAELDADWLWRSRSRVPIVRDWQARVLRSNEELTRLECKR